MSLLALCASLGVGLAAALASFRWLEHHDPDEPRRAPADRYVALPGFPQPDDPVPDIRYALYPPGCLGAYPEQLPPDDGLEVTCEPWAVGAMHREIAAYLDDMAR